MAQEQSVSTESVEKQIRTVKSSIHTLQFVREVKHSVLYKSKEFNGLYLPKFTVLKPVKNELGWPKTVTIMIEQEAP